MTDIDLYAPREAYAVSFPEPRREGEYGMFLAVGSPCGLPPNPKAFVTRILVTKDLAGMSADMERVRVFVGETVVLEAPVHSVEAIHYKSTESTT